MNINIPDEVVQKFREDANKHGEEYSDFEVKEILIACLEDYF